MSVTYRDAFSLKEAPFGPVLSYLNSGSTMSEAPIWAKSPRSRSQIVRRVCEALLQEYGRSRLGNPRDPIDDLLYIVISNKTASKTARAVYERVKGAFPKWQAMLDAPAARLRRILTPAGLAKVKGSQIRLALRQIRRDYGAKGLGNLKRISTPDAERYLTALPGVSEKVAKCVLMYTMNGAVLPVDAHVHRLASRLGWTRRKRADQCHEELEALVPPHRRYAFHVDCVMHGRYICRPSRPLCSECCIRGHCYAFASLQK